MICPMQLQAALSRSFNKWRKVQLKCIAGNYCKISTIIHTILPWNCRHLTRCVLATWIVHTVCSDTCNVCSALWCRNMHPLGCRHLDTGGFSHEVSATDTWCMLVGSCLQCRGASVIWFVNHWWHLTSSTLISGHVACLESGVPTHDALHLMVDTYEGRKASWRRPPCRRRNI